MKKEILKKIVCVVLLVASYYQIVPNCFLEKENKEIVFLEIDIDLETEKETEKETDDQKEKEEQKDKITPILFAYQMNDLEGKDIIQFTDATVRTSQPSIVLPPPEGVSTL